MSKIKELAQIGQSIWYDFIKRDIIVDGTLDKLIANGLRGITSNPSIFEQAISKSELYDSEIKAISNKTVIEVYETIAKKDIRLAAEKMLPVYNATQGLDGYVSFEVNPNLANDAEGTIKEGERIFNELAMPNIMIKVPATKQGLIAITDLTSKGVNVNVTLIFSVDNYIDVAKAYIDGLKKRHAEGKDISKINSVASFFVSRVDASTDKVLLELNKNDLMGKTAISNSKVAYKKFFNLYSSDEWKQLKADGANEQRLLWASTSTKNPDFSDILYVQELIGESTVNTVPPATIDAFEDHGKSELTLNKGLDEALAHLDRLVDLKIDLAAITDELQIKGVDAFAESFRKLLKTIETKIANL